MKHDFATLTNTIYKTTNTASTSSYVGVAYHHYVTHDGVVYDDDSVYVASSCVDVTHLDVDTIIQHDDNTQKYDEVLVLTQMMMNDDSDSVYDDESWMMMHAARLTPLTSYLHTYTHVYIHIPTHIYHTLHSHSSSYIRYYLTHTLKLNIHRFIAGHIRASIIYCNCVLTIV